MIMEYYKLFRLYLDYIIVSENPHQWDSQRLNFVSDEQKSRLGRIY